MGLAGLEAVQGGSRASMPSGSTCRLVKTLQLDDACLPGIAPAPGQLPTQHLPHDNAKGKHVCIGNQTGKMALVG